MFESQVSRVTGRTNDNNINKRRPGDPVPALGNKHKGANAKDTSGRKKRKNPDDPPKTKHDDKQCVVHPESDHKFGQCNYLKRLYFDDNDKYKEFLATYGKTSNGHKAKRSKKINTNNDPDYDIRQDLSRALTIYEKKEAEGADKKAKVCKLCHNAEHENISDCVAMKDANIRKALRAAFNAGKSSGTDTKVNDNAPRYHFAQHSSLTHIHPSDVNLDESRLLTSFALRGKTSSHPWDQVLGKARLFHVQRDRKMYKGSSFNKSLCDSGASSCMSNDLDLFDTFELVHNESVSLPDDTVIPVIGKGSVTLDLGHGHQRVLTDVLYVP
ncbi:hypothetical protein HDU76_011941, partial [Blyttiomyces sp. JEL0837]